MRKKSLVIISIFISSLLVFNCKGKPKKIDFKFNDKNCVIGHEKSVKKNRFIGSFKKLTNKAKMIEITVKPKSKLILFNDKTKWNWAGKIKNKVDLIAKHGCIAVDFVKEKANFVATAITILAPYTVPKEQLINHEQLVKMMGTPPNINKNITLVDSRPRSRWLQASIPGSLSIPLPELKSGKGFAKLPKDKNAKIIFYCGGFHCKLAPFSAKLAVEKGYKNVKVYWAGHPDWKKKGKASCTKAKFLALLNQKKKPIILLDIRKDAIKKDHIPGAYAISFAKIDSLKKLLPQKPKLKKIARIIVYGQGKSDLAQTYQAASKIASWGYKTVSSLHGGFDAYVKAKGKTVKNKFIKKISYVPVKAPGEIVAEEFQKLLANGIPANTEFIDVRGEAEVLSLPGLMVLGAINIPLPELKSKIGNLDKSKTYVVSCSTGMRAGLGRDQMVAAGFKHAFFLKANISNPNGCLALDEKIEFSCAKLSKLTGKTIKKNKAKKMKKATIKIEGC